MSGPALAAVSPAVSAGSAELLKVLKALTAVAIAAGSVGCMGLWPCCYKDLDASCDPTTHMDTLSQMSVVMAA